MSLAKGAPRDFSADRKSTRLNSSHTVIYTLSLHDALPISRLKPPETPMLPFVVLPRPTQESNVIGKGGTAGFLGAAYDPYYFYQDPNKEIKLDDLTLRKDVSKERLTRRAKLLDQVNAAMPEIDKAVSNYALDKYYEKAFDLILSGRARDAFD